MDGRALRGTTQGVRPRPGSRRSGARAGPARPGSGGPPRPLSVVGGRDAPSRSGRKAHNCHPSRGAGGVTRRAEAPAEDARSALTRRSPRSYPVPDFPTSCRAFRGRARTGSTRCRRPAPFATANQSRRWSSRHARSPWAVQRPPVPTGPNRRPDRAAPRSRTPRGIPATRPANSRYWSCSNQQRLHRVGPLLWPRAPVRRPAIPESGLARLPSLPVPRLPLRVRHRHKITPHRYVTDLGEGTRRREAAGRSRGRPAPGSGVSSEDVFGAVLTPPVDLHRACRVDAGSAAPGVRPNTARGGHLATPSRRFSAAVRSHSRCSRSR